MTGSSAIRIEGEKLSFHLGGSFHQLLPLRVPRARLINDNVIDVAGSFPEQVEGGNSVVAMSFGKGISLDPDTLQIRDASKPGHLHRVCEPVVLYVELFQR